MKVHYVDRQIHANLRHVTLTSRTKSDAILVSFLSFVLNDD